MTKGKQGFLRPLSLRQGSAAAVALGVTAASWAAPAMAQETPGDAEEVQLDTLQIEDQAADVNPYTSKGAPYKARTSGDPRRVKPLAETPATITVLTETQIEESGSTDLRDILKGQPGVTLGTGENGNAFGDRYIIRGEEARSDVFVDGLRDPGMTTRESFAVDQIEVTKGPSASFAGRGATGGAVNAITKQARDEYSFNKVDLGIGTDNFWRATLDSNWALSEGAAIRANLLYSYQDVPDRSPADRERWGAAISGSLRISDAVRVVLDYYHLDAEDRPDLGSYTTPATADSAGEPYDDIPVYAQDEDFLKSKVDTITGKIIVEPFDGLKVINATRYGWSKNGYVTTGARGGENAASISLSDHQGWQDVDYFVNQLNAIGSFNTGSLVHNVVVGSEYSDNRVVNGTYSLTRNGVSNCVGGRGPGYCITDADGNVIVDDISSFLDRTITKGDFDADWQVKTLSFYAMDTIDVTPWLSINGGVRMDAVDFSLITRTDRYVQSDTLWNGNAGITLKPTESLIVYANWGTASNINGGESDLGANCGYGGLCVSDDVPLSAGKPEKSTTYEIGAKWNLFEDRLLLTAAAFQTTKDDVFEIAGGNSGYTPNGSINTGKTRVKGIELGLVGNITDRLSGQAGVVFMDAEVRDSYDPANIGRTLSNFADTQASAQLRYQATEAFAFGSTVTYKSEMFAGQPDSAAGWNATVGRYSYRVPSSLVFDGFAEYRFNETFSARVNVANIGDEDYYTAAYRSGAFLYKGDERRGTLTLTGRF